jgi:hypothetical protein
MERLALPILAVLAACSGGAVSDDDDDDDTPADAPVVVDAPAGDGNGADASPLDAPVAVDAPPPVDAAPDAPLPLVPIQVRVNEYFDPDPYPNATVWFTAPDGSVIGQGTTNASGILDGMGTPGGAVTVRRDVPLNGARWNTIVGIQSGDVLRFGPHYGQPQGQMTFLLPPAPHPYFTVKSPCGPEGGVTGVANQEQPINASLFECPATGTFLFQSESAAGDRYFLVANNVPIAAGTTYAVVGTWTPPQSRSVTFINYPGGTANAAVQDVVDHEIILGSWVASLTNGTATWLGPDSGGILASLFIGTFAHQQGFAHGAGVSTIDATPRVPVIGPTQLVPGGAQWTLSAGPIDSQGASAIQLTSRWSVILPPGTTSLRFPQIPGLPVSNLHVGLLDTEGSPPYAQIRAWGNASTRRALWGGPLPSNFSIQSRGN